MGFDVLLGEPKGEFPRMLAFTRGIHPGAAAVDVGGRPVAPVAQLLRAHLPKLQRHPRVLLEVDEEALLEDIHLDSNPEPRFSREQSLVSRSAASVGFQPNR